MLIQIPEVLPVYAFQVLLIQAIVFAIIYMLVRLSGKGHKSGG